MKPKPSKIPSKTKTKTKPKLKQRQWSKPIKKKSSPEPPSELLMINPTDQQIHRFKPTDQPIPAQRSKPSSPIHADPTSKIQNPGDGDEASEMREQMEKQRRKREKRIEKMREMRERRESQR